MTNREYIESLTNEEIAEFLSEMISDCDDCPIQNYCEKDSDLKGLCNHIWVKWLEDEYEEEKKWPE